MSDNEELKKDIDAIVDYSLYIAGKLDFGSRTNISQLIEGNNKELVNKIKNIQKTRFTGDFEFQDGDKLIQASFKNGWLHSDNGVAWSESYDGDISKRAWAKNGIIEAINYEEIKFVLNKNIGDFEIDSVGDIFNAAVSRFNRPALKVINSTGSQNKPISKKQNKVCLKLYKGKK